MNEIQLGVITLMKSAITGEKLPLPDGFAVADALPILKKHGIQTMGYLGAANCGISKADPVMQSLFRDYCLSAVVNHRQLTKIQQLFTALDENGVDYMPLKGAVLKQLYPAPELRPMADADILIRIEQYGCIRSVMKSLGFSEGPESDHELIWRCDELYVELHKHLVSCDDKKAYSYYGDCWHLANKQNGSGFRMSAEDQFVFLFNHFVKHFRNGGIGCRHVVDLWIFLRNYPEMDYAYIEQELNKLHMIEFYQNMLSLLNCWFDGCVCSKKVDFISDFIFNSGIWGDQKSHDLAENAWHVRLNESSGKGKWRCFLNRVFPGADSAAYQYPILKKCPYLLPAVWVVRWGHIALYTPDVMKRRFQMLDPSNNASVAAWKKNMEYVGLGYSEDL